MLTALEKTKSDFILFTPCDTPFFPTNLLDKLQSAVKNDSTLISYACDDEREHPVFCLMSVQLKEKLRHYLASGDGGISVKFTKEEGHFENFNTLDDLDSYSSDDFKEG